MVRHRFASPALAATVVLLGCGGPATPRPTPPAVAAVVTLKALENGDRACYVVIESAAGEQSIEGAFELCAGGAHDATALIGQRVTYTTERANVAAAACEGDLDCGQSDSVELVISIVAAP